MKKISILLLACFPIALFSQQLPTNYEIATDHSGKNFTEYKSASQVDEEMVFATINEDLAFDSERLNSNSFLDPTEEKMAKNMSNNMALEVLKYKDSDLGEGVVTFSKNRKIVYFSVNRRIKNKVGSNGNEITIKKTVMLHLFRADVDENGNWANLEMLPFNSNRYSTGHPVLNPDDTKLYFVSDGPESMGRTDIFVVDLNKDGTYGKPENLGPKVNSSEREIFPFIDKNNLFYFSSDAQNSKGELDVFSCKIFDNTLSTPVKIKGYVNIKENDFVYNIDDQEHLAYFSSNMLAGKEIENIYSKTDDAILNVDCQQQISGTILNADTQELMPEVEVKLYDDQNNIIMSSISDGTNATFSFNESCNGNYKLKAFLEGYMVEEINIQTVNDLNAEPMVIVMNMKKAAIVQAEITVKQPDPINFEASLDEKDEVEKSTLDTPIDENGLSSTYNFNSNSPKYTVQIGAFKEHVYIDQYYDLSSLYHHVYGDGFDRYFSGVFDTHLDAKNYLLQLKSKGFSDAFIVGLKGEERF